MICRYKIKFISDIEQKIRKLLVNIAVAPFVGVWIEIQLLHTLQQVLMSLPSWECGLKSNSSHFLTGIDKVAPFVGVWIEIVWNHCSPHKLSVAPFVGVWIEIGKSMCNGDTVECRSLRGSVD